MESLRVVVRLPPRDATATSTATTTAAAASSPTTSNADEEASDDHGVAQKKRKSAYHTQKETMMQLRDQVAALQAELDTMRSAPRGPEWQLRAAMADNRAMKKRSTQHRHAIAGVQSLASSYGSQHLMSPLATNIHLPGDAVQRQEVLDKLKPGKIQKALAFMLARGQFQDLRRQTRQLESYETESGDRIALQWELHKFTQRNASVRRVYDELIEFARTHEMALADKRGLLAIRESDVCADNPDAAQVRMLVSHQPFKLLVEKNLVVFSQFMERSDLLEQPHGLLLFEFVGKDDAYPYQPASRIRKDVSSVTMIVECSRESSVDTQPAVALVKWSHIRTHRSPLATDEELGEIAREGAFFEVMVQTIREQLVWKAS